MKYALHTRIFMIAMLVLALLSGTAYVIHSYVLLPSLLALERQLIDADVRRVVHALENEQHHLMLLANDWSAWDDTYNYLIDHNREYEESNLVDSTFDINQVNLIYLLDNSGRKVWGKVFAADQETVITPQPFAQETFTPDFPLLRYHSDQTPLNEQQVAGLFMTSAGPMLCAARPVLDSDDSGPSHGTLVMGRFLSDAMIKKISRLSGTRSSVESVAKKGGEGSAEKEISYRTQDNTLFAEMTYPDLLGNPAIKITVQEEREILAQGLKALRAAIILMAIGITLSLALMLLMLQWSVVSPLRHLTRRILARRQSKQTWQDMTMAAGVSREIHVLTDEFNQLMSALDDKGAQLAKTNRDLLVETGKLKDAQASLRNLDQLKSEFISTAAHELRTPITCVMGFSELLTDQETLPFFSEEQKQDFLHEVYENCERLTKLVDDILDISRIEAGQSLPLDKFPMSLEVLLGKVVNNFKLRARQQLELDLRPGFPETLVADTHRISQVMENLLSNAIKYSAHGSRILVVAERQGPHCKVTVSDQGIGMNEEQVARIFDKFYRADASDSAVRGLGLGMSIVKQIIEDHGGTIRVESVEGEGTRIDFTLPINSPT